MIAVKWCYIFFFTSFAGSFGFGNYMGSGFLADWSWSLQLQRVWHKHTCLKYGFWALQKAHFKDEILSSWYFACNQIIPMV